MRITPLDIQQRQFSTKFRGFHSEEVSTFLEQIREEIEDLLRENAALKEQISVTESEIWRFRDMQAQLARTLHEAHQIADESRIQGRREADGMLSDAEEKARELVGRVHEKALEINEEIVDLRMMRKHFHEDMRETLAGFMDILDGKRPVHSSHRSGTAGQDPTVPEYLQDEESGGALLPDEQIGVVEGHAGEEAGGNPEQA